MTKTGKIEGNLELTSKIEKKKEREKNNLSRKKNMLTKYKEVRGVGVGGVGSLWEAALVKSTTDDDWHPPTSRHPCPYSTPTASTATPQRCNATLPSQRATALATTATCLFARSLASRSSVHSPSEQVTWSLRGNGHRSIHNQSIQEPVLNSKTILWIFANSTTISILCSTSTKLLDSFFKLTLQFLISIHLWFLAVNYYQFD